MRAYGLAPQELEVSLAQLKESEAMFRRQSEALAETDRRKDEFLAMLAHELRNPLAPIRNAVEVMRRDGELPTSLEGVRDMVDRQVSHLVRLVDDLVDASRIWRGKLVLTRKPVELTGLINEAIDSSAVAIARRSISIRRAAAAGCRLRRRRCGPADAGDAESRSTMR